MANPIFISYSRKDSEFVQKLALDLHDRNVAVWFDKSDLQPGMEWRTALEKNVQTSAAFVLIVSPDSMKSEYVGAELDWAIKHNRPIIPLFYRKTKLTQAVEAKISEHQYLMFTEGGYAQNFIDLTNGLIHLKIPVETDEAEIAERRRQRLGARVKPAWGQVLTKSFGWALAWALGWAIFWLVLPLLLLLVGSNSEDVFSDYGLFPIIGLMGGASGGLLAGLVTMFILRHYAQNIGWKHMKASITIWGVFAPIATLVAGGGAALVYTTFNAFSSSPCDGGFGECLGQGLGDVLGYMIVIVFVIFLWAIVALFGIGALAGRRAVKHIRKLEPGILGSQAGWVIVAWSIGGVVSLFLGLIGAELLGF